MQNGPHEYAVDHTSFYVISKLFTQTFLIGRGDVTFLHIAYVKSTKNVGKLTCVFGRFKNPFFLWLIQILKAVTMIMVTAIAFFWSFMRNPAIPVFGLGSAFAQIAPVGFFAIIFLNHITQPSHACLGDVAAMACPWGFECGSHAPYKALPLFPQP